jgi:hypothetical protein
MEGLPRDVGASIRGQKNHRPGKVLRYLDSAERDVFLELGKERTVVGMHRGVHGAGSDCVHPNVLGSHVLSRRPRLAHAGRTSTSNSQLPLRPG